MRRSGPRTGKFLIDRTAQFVEKGRSRIAAQMIASQTEFPLSVAVCAWCRPKEHGQEAGSLSHGICLRHLRKMKLEAQGLVVRRISRSAPISVEKAAVQLLPL
jgi:hypothetical protein